ncbi:hypothetical protein KEM55_001539, partial [Ascosphaera atra]
VGALKAQEVVRAKFVNGRTPRRDLVYKAGATVRDLSSLNNSQVVALMVLLGGEEASAPCRPCQVGNPFMQCIVSDVGGNGECAACKLLSNPGRCNLRKWSPTTSVTR